MSKEENPYAEVIGLIEQSNSPNQIQACIQFIDRMLEKVNELPNLADPLFELKEVAKQKLRTL